MARPFAPQEALKSFLSRHDLAKSKVAELSPSNIISAAKVAAADLANSVAVQTQDRAIKMALFRHIVRVAAKVG